jgi:polyketide cyclase/dehydrase/lipid transport protein
VDRELTRERTGRRIAATRVVPVPPATAFAFLAVMHNHWKLAGERIQLVDVGSSDDRGASGVVMIRGPLGLRRRARTRVLEVRAPLTLGGTAEVGRGTVAQVRWDLKPRGEQATTVTLSAAVVTAGRLDRLLLLAGGRAWMRRVFARTLVRLEGELVAGPVPAGGSEPVEQRP